MTEEEQNLEISYFLDADDNGLNLSEGRITLRDLLSAVHRAQTQDNRWIAKLIGKRPVSVDEVMWEAPVVTISALRKDHAWLGHHILVKDRLRVLTNIGLLDSRISHNRIYYRVTLLGKAFVNYNEKN